MNKIGLNTARLNTALLNVAYTNGFPVLSKRSGSSADISQAIMDSLVCWYDPGKQQCTNESMAANPVLTDLSGNGHDITCYNFAWSGMSGIGGYTNFTNNTARANIERLGAQHWLINSINQDNAVNKECILIPKKAFNTFFCGKKIQVKLTGNVLSKTFFKVDKTKIYLKEGVNEITIPAIDSEDFINTGYLVFNFPLETINVELEILPFYPNALVSDGVDDYYQVLPTYPKEVGTCFLTAQSLEDDESSYILYMSDNKEESGIIHSWRGTTVGFNNKNKIMLRGVNEKDEEISKMSYSDLSGKGTIVFTWNNNIPLMVGRINDERIELGLEQPHTKYSWGTDFNYGNIRRKFAFYSFLLFDRDLTEQEIEWVKKNMIESGGVLKTDWSDSSLWAFRDGIHVVNDKRVEGTLSSNMMVITSCINTNNFMEVFIENTQIPAYNIKVTGLKNGITLQYKDGNTATYLYFNEDGIYTIPAHNANSRWYGFSFNKTFENENIVIQQLLS